MIFELPIEHFPVNRTASSTTIVRTENRSSFGLKLPFSTASCLEISKAVQDEPSVTRATFNFGKSASVQSLVATTRMPRLSLSVPPVRRISMPATTRKPSICERIANSLPIPTVTA